MMRGKGFIPNRGRGRRMIGNKPGSGPGGRCICPSCGHTVTHSRLKPCNERECPRCGTVMTRE